MVLTTCAYKRHAQHSVLSPCVQTVRDVFMFCGGGGGAWEGSCLYGCWVVPISMAANTCLLVFAHVHACQSWHATTIFHNDTIIFSWRNPESEADTGR